jgi:hypothetical protein
MMAGKARLLSDVIEKALTSDETNHEDSTLKDQMKAFKQILIHDITRQKVLQTFTPKPLLTECLQLVYTTQLYQLSADKKQPNLFRNQIRFYENCLATLQVLTLTTV